MTEWSQGGFAFYVSEYPEEGCVGPYKTREEAEEAAKYLLPDDDTEICELTEDQCLALEEDLNEDLHNRS